MVPSHHCGPMMTETGRILPPVVPLPPNNVKLSPIFLSHSRSELQPAGFPGGPRHQQRVIRLETESAGSGVVWCQSSPVRPCCSSAVELRWLGRREEGVRHWESPWCSACSRRKLKTLFFRSKIAASVGRPKDRGVAKMFLSGPRWWLD